MSFSCNKSKCKTVGIDVYISLDIRVFASPSPPRIFSFHFAFKSVWTKCFEAAETYKSANMQSKMIKYVDTLFMND